MTEERWKTDARAPLARRDIDLLSNLKLQIAACVRLWVGKLDAHRYFSWLGIFGPCIDVPVVVAALRTFVYRVLHLLQSGQIEVEGTLVKVMHHLRDTVIKKICVSIMLQPCDSRDSDRTTYAAPDLGRLLQNPITIRDNGVNLIACKHVWPELNAQTVG